MANYLCRTLLDRNVRFWHFRERFESFIAAVIRVSAVAGKKCVDILTMNQNSSLVDFWNGFILDNWSLSRLLVDFCLDFWSTFVSTFGRFLSIWPLVDLTSDRFWPSIDFYTLDCCRFHLTFGLWLSRSPTGRFWPVIRDLIGIRSFRSSLADRLPKWPRLTLFDPSQSLTRPFTKLFYFNFYRIGFGFRPLVCS